MVARGWEGCQGQGYLRVVYRDGKMLPPPWRKVYAVQSQM
jgi:hypothetical protein